METRISFPGGVSAPGILPPFLVSSMRPSQGSVTGYGDINSARVRLNQRVGPVRSPLGPVNGYRDQTRPLGAATYIPANLPGPIYPGTGTGMWHVGPTVVRQGIIPYGTYSGRMARSDAATFRTYGAYAPPKAGAAGMLGAVAFSVATGALFGAVAALLIPGTTAKQGASVGAVSALLSLGLSVGLSTITGMGRA